MTKYIIEGNINFQEELLKSLNYESENEDELCQITGLPLQEYHVILECKHHFNYKALYNEIYKQKYEFKTYDPHSLHKKNLQKFREAKLDYFIKCPYCRNIQFTVLPFYKELGLKEVYGINSLDKTLPNTILIPNSNLTNNYSNKSKLNIYNDPNFSFNLWGLTFKLGECCEKINNFGDFCPQKFVSSIPNTQIFYCKYHYKGGLKSYKLSEKKNKMMEIKIAANKEKENKLNEKKKLLYEMNIEREANGLPLLKRLPTLNKKTENIVGEQNNQIPIYIPDETQMCTAILKYGSKKGMQCGCKKIETNGLCKRHLPMNQNDKI